MKSRGSVEFSAVVFKSGETHAMWARKLGCSQSTVTRMISGEHKPTSYALRMSLSNFAGIAPGAWDVWVDASMMVVRVSHTKIG